MKVKLIIVLLATLLECVPSLVSGNIRNLVIMCVFSLAFFSTAAWSFGRNGENV